MRIVKIFFVLISIICISYVFITYIIFLNYKGKADSNNDVDFSKLSIDEKISKASLIVLAEYELESKGALVPRVSYVYKNETDNIKDYAVGKELVSGVYFPKDGEGNPDYVFIIYSGVPPDPVLKIWFSKNKLSLSQAKTDPETVLNYLY